MEVCNSGLDIRDAPGFPVSVGSIVINVKSAPNDVSSFGFDVCYPSDKLEYIGPTGVLDPSDLHLSELLSGWTMVGINVLESGRLSVGGMTVANAIVKGATGSLIKKIKAVQADFAVCGRMLEALMKFVPHFT